MTLSSYGPFFIFVLRPGHQNMFNRQQPHSHRRTREEAHQEALAISDEHPDWEIYIFEEIAMYKPALQEQQPTTLTKEGGNDGEA